MKKTLNCLYLLMLFTLFIPRVYASFTYDINVEVETTSLKKGSLAELKVVLNNIKGDNKGIVTCSMNISFDNNILLDSKIRSLNSWTVTTGNFYIFDTRDIVFDNSEMFIVPVKVNGNGSVKLFNIMCSDGVTEESTSDKEIKFSIVSEDDNNTDNNLINDNVDTKVSNANLSNIILSEGTIDFDPNVTEYSVEISDFSKLEITPILESDKAQSVIDKNILMDNNNIVITVTAENGDTKVYTIYVEEKASIDDNKEDNNISKDKNIYTPIFIGIICVLVIINIIRIVKSKKK